MKKLIFSMMTAVTVCSLLTACDDDDDAGSTVYNADATVLTTSDGKKLLVTECDSYFYEYDDEGNMTAIGDYDVTTNPFTLVRKTSSSYDSLSVTTNSKGYVSKLYAYSDYYEITYDFSYDNSGHLTKIIESGYETDLTDEIYDSDYYSESYTITWNDDLLTKITLDFGDEEDYETITYNYDDDEYFNATKQYCPTLFSYGVTSSSGEPIEHIAMFAYIGLLGFGPDYLPTSWEDYNYDSGYIDEYNYNCSYSFNDNGTLNYWKYGSCKGYITYDDYPE